MKNLPNKIYLNLGDLTEEEFNETDFKDLSEVTWSEDDVQGRNVEYIRKDAFIENVCDWLSDTLQTVVDVNIPSAHHVESIPALGVITQTEFIEKFKKEIEYLLD